MVAVKFLSRRLKAVACLIDSCKGLEKLCQFIHYFKVFILNYVARELKQKIEVC